MHEPVKEKIIEIFEKLEYSQREHQLVLLKALISMSIDKNYVVSQVPCAFGKSVILLLLAFYQSLVFNDGKARVILCLPNDLLRWVTSVKSETLIKNEQQLKDPNQTGLFICTAEQLIELQVDCVKGSFLVIDELHEVRKFSKAKESLKLPAKIVSLTATLGPKGEYGWLKNLFDGEIANLNDLECL